MKIKKIILGVVLCVIPSLGFAQSGSHGGDPRCQEFAALAVSIANELNKVGQEKMTQVNPKIDVAALWAKINRPLLVTPVQTQDRVARTNAVTAETTLLVNEWEKLNIWQKIELTTHELMVLIGAETDGVYGVSQDLFAYLQTTEFFKKLGAVTSSPCYLAYQQMAKDKRHTFRNAWLAAQVALVFPAPFIPYIIASIATETAAYIATGALTVTTATVIPIYEPSEAKVMKLASTTTRQFRKMKRKVGRDDEEISQKRLSDIIFNGFTSGDFCKSEQTRNGLMRRKEIRQYILMKVEE